MALPLQPNGMRRSIHWVKAQVAVETIPDDVADAPDPDSPDPPDPRGSEVEWVQTIRFSPEGEDLMSLLEHFYKIEYYRSMISSQAFRGVPRRQENMLRLATDSLYSTGGAIACRLLPVFENWLDSHALTDPEQWARARTLGDEWDFPVRLIDAGGLSGVIEGMLSEWARYAVFGGDSVEQYRAARSPSFRMPSLDLPDSDEELQEDYPALYEILSRVLREEEISWDSEDEGEEWPEYDATDILERYRDIYGNDEEFLEELLANEDPQTQMDVIVDLQKNLVFPHWFSYWQPQGIEDTRKRIEDAAEFLREACSSPRSFDPGRLSSMLNWTLNISHHSGQMMDYVESEHDVTASDLDSLSRQDTSEWDSHLRTLGVMARRHAVVVKVAGF